MRHPFKDSPPFIPMTDAVAATFDAALRVALDEDVGAGDVTTNAIIPESAVATADIVVRRRGILAGLALALRTFAMLDPGIHIERRADDGVRVEEGTAVARLSGPA